MNKFDLGVKTSIYNNEMRRRRKELGLSQLQLADRVNMSVAIIGEMETFKRYPKYETMDLIASELGTDVETLCPEWLREQRLKKSSQDRSVMVDRIQLNAPEVLQLKSETKLEDDVDSELLSKSLSKMLEILTDRETKILTLRFGLDGNHMHTLEEVGKEFGVTRDRIRQVEQKAILKIRKSKEGKSFGEKISLGEVLNG